MAQYRVFPVLSPIYSITMWERDTMNLPLPIVFDDMSREVCARRLRIARKHAQTFHIVISRTWQREEIGHIPVCSGCLARMVDGEYDCDGWFWNVSCDSPQCDWWASTRARKAAQDREALADVMRFLA